jgi:hypothetical protein
MGEWESQGKKLIFLIFFLKIFFPIIRIDEAMIERSVKLNIQAYLPNVMENGFIEVKERSDCFQLYDLDKMYEKSILPMLFNLFNMSRDYTLNSSTLKLIFKCFSQRARLIKSLKKIHILIDEKDHILFERLNQKITELKFICEQSEVWLTTPAKMNSSKFNYKFVIYRVIDLLKEFIDVLYGSTDLEINNLWNNRVKIDYKLF